ncbi:MAG TPA: AI-2E family transporter [Planctomycetaceae bacterium]|nr:AI-2E family transporter [Planctomycetaceae bacterium]
MPAEAGNGRDAPSPPDFEPWPKRRPAVYGPRHRPVALTILATLAVIYTVYLGRSLLFPIILSCILYFLFRPMVRWMQRRRVPALAGAAVVVSGLLVTAGTGIYVLASPATTWFEEIPDNLRQVEVKFWYVFQRIRNIERASKQVQQIAAPAPAAGAGGSATSPEVEADPEPEVQVVEFRQPSLTQTVLTSTGEVSAGVVIVVVLLYLLLALGDSFLNKILQLRPTFRDKRGIVELVRNIEQGISRYLGTITVINACLGIVIGSVMGLLGLPNPLLWGVMAAALNFVPYLGALVGAIAVGVAALIQFDSVAYAALAPLSYFVINSIEGNLITPMLLGRSMSLSPVLVFLSLVVWGWMWGIGGVLIAVPVLGIAKIICEHFRSLRPLANLLGQ